MLQWSPADFTGRRAAQRLPLHAGGNQRRHLRGRLICRHLSDAATLQQHTLGSCSGFALSSEDMPCRRPTLGCGCTMRFDGQQDMSAC